MSDQKSKFQKSSSKKKYDKTHPALLTELDKKQREKIKELENILENSTDFLDEKDIKNIKRLLSKLNIALLKELKDALINKQMSQFKAIEVLNEGNETDPS